MITTQALPPIFVEFTPTKDKRPFLKDWQQRPITAEQALHQLNNPEAEADGIAGIIPKGYVVLDCDGPNVFSAYIWKRLAKRDKRSLQTLAWGSGPKETGRFKIVYRLPDGLEAPARKLVKKLGSEQKLELLFADHPVTLPPSKHPDYGQYQYHCPQGPEQKILNAPDWLIALIGELIQKQQARFSDDNLEAVEVAVGDIWTLLNRIAPDDYDDWIYVGMQLKGLGDEYFDIWEEWSFQSNKYRAGECDRKWRSFDERPNAWSKLCKAAGISPPQQSQRDRAIARRQFRFNQALESGLRIDFTLTKTESQKLNIYKGYVPSLDLTQHRTTAIQGGLGSGKTEAVLNALPEEGAVWIAPRNGLLKDTGARAKRKSIQWLHFQDDVVLGREYLRDGLDGAVIALSYHSLSEYHFIHIDWRDKTVIIDEFSELRKSILGYPRLENEFRLMVRECKHLVIADAFLSDADLKVVTHLRGASDRIIYKQDFIPDLTPVKWLETRNKKGDISFSHDCIYLEIIRDWTSQGLSFAVASDSASHARILEAEAKKLGIRTQLCWSKLIESNRDFLPRINQTLEEHGIQGFFYTPTIQSGADVQVKFDRVLVIAQGILSPLQILQISKRVRNAGEIWVSAPRKTADPASVTTNLDGDRLRSQIEKIKQAFAENELDTPIDIQGWGLWERLTHEIERSFNSEYIHELLRRYFANVETLEIQGTDLREWQERTRKLKLGDAEQILSADLARGQDLLRAKAEPRNESEAWAIELANLHKTYPKPTRRLIDEFEDSLESREDALKFCNILRGKRLDKLKYWLIAEQGDPDDDARFVAAARSHQITYAAPIVKVRQYTNLYRLLKLKRLACVDQKQKLAPEDNCFHRDSPTVGQLWKEFRGNRKLRQLFPLIETQTDLWTEIRQCLSFLGFEKRSHQARIETQDLHPNGRYRDGRQRYSKSRTFYFLAWVRMEESGSRFFKYVFPELVKAINEELDWARNCWRKRREEGVDPPWAQVA